MSIVESAYLQLLMFQHGLHKSWQILRPTAGNHIPIHHNGFIHPNGTGVDKVILNAGCRGHCIPLAHARRSGHPPSVTNMRHQFSRLHKLPSQFLDLIKPTQLIGGESAGKDHPIKIPLLHVLDRRIARAGVSVLARINGPRFGCRNHHFRSRFFKPQLGVPQLQILIDIFNKNKITLAFCALAKLPLFIVFLIIRFMD